MENARHKHFKITALIRDTKFVAYTFKKIYPSKKSEDCILFQKYIKLRLSSKQTVAELEIQVPSTPSLVLFAAMLPRRWTVRADFWADVNKLGQYLVRRSVFAKAQQQERK